MTERIEAMLDIVDNPRVYEGTYHYVDASVYVLCTLFIGGAPEVVCLSRTSEDKVCSPKSQKWFTQLSTSSLLEDNPKFYQVNILTTSNRIQYGKPAAIYSSCARFSIPQGNPLVQAFRLRLSPKTRNRNQKTPTVHHLIRILSRNDHWCFLW